MTKRAIWWIRRDPRLADNQTLAAALAYAEQVIPFFILDPTILHAPTHSARRLAFLLDGLTALNADLRLRGSQLIVRTGRPVDLLPRFCQEQGVDTVFAEADYSAYATQRDQKVAQHVDLVRCPGVTIRPIGTVRQKDGRPYRIFTPYNRQWKAQGPIQPSVLLPAPSHIPTPVLLTDELPTVLPVRPEAVLFPAGEAEAQRRLTAFATGSTAAIFRYAQERNRLDLQSTSQLSPYLRFGMVSPRTAAAYAYQAHHAAPDDHAWASSQIWLDELIWREFYINLLHDFPHVQQGSFRQEYNAIQWRNDEAEFAAWCEGRTGYPLVDASMRCLRATGWLHNRLRMVVASFLVKDLLIDWRWGERWFMQQLVDGDPAANNGGWQWSAGVGADAAPYFRFFNPVAQGEKFDPAGCFVRRWAPELVNVPTLHIHAPWHMSAGQQASAHCRIGVDYPAPLVDHQQARERALAAYQKCTPKRKS